MTFAHFLRGGGRGSEWDERERRGEEIENHMGTFKPFGIR